MHGIEKERILVEFDSLLVGMQQNQVAFKSYPVEPIGPLACTSDGAYLAGGGVSGRIYFWEVSLGDLKMQNA